MSIYVNGPKKQVFEITGWNYRLKWFQIEELEKGLVYCTDILQLIHKLGVTQCQSEEWSIFIYSRKQSMKSVLLCNGNQFASVPIAHSTTPKEKYEAVKYVQLVKLRYD